MERNIDKSAECLNDGIKDILTELELLKTNIANCKDEDSWKEIREKVTPYITNLIENANKIKKATNSFFFEYGYYSNELKKVYSWNNLDDIEQVYCKIRKEEVDKIEGNEELFNKFLALIEKEYKCNYNSEEIRIKMDNYMRSDSDVRIIIGLGRQLNQ